MARLTERAFENAVVRLRDGQGALGQSALDALHEQREELANQMLARLAGSDEFSAMLERNFAPYRRLMTYYECAMMEVETKFRVLDAEFGLQHDRNPIESIKSRLKSTDSLAKKLVRKGFPVSVDSIVRTYTTWRACAWCARFPRICSPWLNRCCPKTT